jgi:NhaP-type Na+/H+ or K+/H+ antiporter
MLPDFIVAFGIISVILVVTALASGIVERSPVSFPLMFLGFGFLIGNRGFSIIDIGLRDPIIEIVATLTLSLVLFQDATKLQLTELGRRWVIPVLVLGPGTALIIILGAIPLILFMNFGWLLALAGGAMLASTDPVVLREIVRDHRIPRSVRQILRIEAGMNDIVVLPVILILITIALGDTNGSGAWLLFIIKLMLLGPGIGLVIGSVGSWLMAKMDDNLGVRREYQALYGIGIVLASYSMATVAGGDGFLAAFTSGLAVVFLNQTLCDSFLEYGEVSLEIAMMSAFVMFGVVLSDMIGTVEIIPAIAVACVIIFVLRPSVIAIVLSKARISWEARSFVSWFGPRGLNSLLLGLLVVQAGIPQSEYLFAVVGIVIIGSVIVHGASASQISKWYGHRASMETLEEDLESTAAGLFGHNEVDVQVIKPKELYDKMQEIPPPLILDVRTRSSYEREGYQIPRSVRVLPDQVFEWVKDLPAHRLITTYCTCRNEATSARAAQLLRSKGIDAVVLDGGLNAWKDEYPVEPLQKIGSAR